MPLDLSPLRYRLSRIVRRSTDDLHRFADRSWVHAPAGIQRQSSPIHLPDELDRVLEICEFSTFETERERLFAPTRRYPATEIFELRDAAVVNGRIYRRGGRFSLRDNALSARHILPRILPREALGYVAGNVHSWHFFGHWLTDQLAGEWMGYHLGYPVWAADRSFRHLEAYRAVLPWSAAPLVSSRFDRLMVSRDVGQNPSRVARQHALHQHLRAQWPGAPGPGVVFLARGSTGSLRELVNEQEIEQYVLKAGGRVLVPETTPVRELAQALRDARLVMGVEGSALTHAIMLAPATATLLVIQPPRRFHNILKTYTDGLGQRYAFTVADECTAGFRLPLDRLQRIVDLVDTAGANLPVDTTTHHRSPSRRAGR